MLLWLSRDGKLLLVARALRGLAYGSLGVAFPIYLRLTGLKEVEIGILITVALIGSAASTLLVSLYGERFGRRKTLIVLGLLMAVSGLVFAFSANYAPLLLIALVGTINLSGSDVGPFLSVEQAIIPQASSAEKRTTAFSLYSTIGTLALAFGAVLGALPDFLMVNFGFDLLTSFRPVLLIYSLLALVSMSTYMVISEKVEVIGGNGRARSILKPESRRRISRLALLFSLDSFAGGFVLQSIVALWFFTRFSISLSLLALIFFSANILTSISFLVAVRIANRIGLIRTMVFTHIPSNILLILVPLAPSFPIALTLYLARMSLSQMDVPTRQSYIVGIVSPEERIPAAGFTNISRNISQAMSPSIAGYALQFASLSFPFLIGGSLKIIYDLSLYFEFRRIRPPEE